MFERELEHIVKKLRKGFPAIGITGPRQSGKTTLAKLCFPHLPYVSFENIEARQRFITDPKGFVRHYANGAIFDEVQHVPDILSYLQGVIDEKDEDGRFVITGSQNFALSAVISQSLAGRIGMLTLLPLSLSELSFSANKDVNKEILYGGYPRLRNKSLSPFQFYSSYINTYIERDVRQIRYVEDLNLFQKFLYLCAGRTGQLLNLSSLANDVGITHVTAKKWISLLEASYICFTLKPYYNNFNKRLIKMPKLYFYDTGLACALLGISSEEHLDKHYAKGHLYENIVILELMKKRFNQGLPNNLFFWRNSSGNEVDCLQDDGGKLKAFEIKSGSTINNDYFKGLNYLRGITEIHTSYLVYNGDQKGSWSDVILTPTYELKNIK